MFALSSVNTSFSHGALNRFAFVDANKSESGDYFRFIHPHLKVGGIYTCDNVLSHKEKVKTYIDAINSRTDYIHTILDLPAGLSFARKVK